jgi:hypothetical protein
MSCILVLLMAIGVVLCLLLLGAEVTRKVTELVTI